MKKIILASSNQGKIREIKAFCHLDVVSYSDIINPFDIVEDGNTFKENALIKARAIYEKIKTKEDNFFILSDDSGISVPILGNEPGIFSARYAGKDASDKDNLFKLIDEIAKKSLSKTPAFYTAAMALIDENGNEWSVHGWMYGDVIDEPRGENGFGYDPIFIPNGYDKTLGELDSSVKKELSHRSKALMRVKTLLNSI